VSCRAGRGTGYAADDGWLQPIFISITGGIISATGIQGSEIGGRDRTPARNHQFDHNHRGSRDRPWYPVGIGNRLRIRDSGPLVSEHDHDLRRKYRRQRELGRGVGKGVSIIGDSGVAWQGGSGWRALALTRPSGQTGTGARPSNRME
jgi:hypothetical protein